MNRNWSRIVPATIAVAATSALTLLTAGSASAASAGTYESSLAGVSCPSATDCLAVGWSASTVSGLSTLGEVWNGTAWKIVPTPPPSGPGFGGQLNAISCTSGSDCMAVGQGNIGSAKGIRRMYPLAEAWNGTKWTIVPTPKLSQKAASLNGVSCASSTSCVAVGWQGPLHNTTQLTLAESWNGSTWAVVPTPKPSASGGASLNAVSCLSATNCIAAGDDGYSNQLVTSLTLAEKWNGSSWTQLATPTPGGNGSFGGVTCPSATDCIAVGQHVNQYGAGVTFVAVWNGTTWTAQPSPSPAGSVAAGLGSISCTSAAACMATGSAFDQIGETLETLAESWNGQVWTKLRTPSPRYTNELNGVACTSASNCQSVGDTSGEEGKEVTLGVAWNGTKWSMVSTPNP
jgi:hypothetical protein